MLLATGAGAAVEVFAGWTNATVVGLLLGLFAAQLLPVRGRAGPIDGSATRDSGGDTP